MYYTPSPPDKPTDHQMQVLRTLNNGKQHYCGVFHPDPDKQNVLMSGCQDKKIYQWDLDTGDVMQVCNWIVTCRGSCIVCCVSAWARIRISTIGTLTPVT